MQTWTEPGSFFGESCSNPKNSFGITASSSNDLNLNVVDHVDGKELSVSLTPDNLDELESIIGICRAWIRSEERSRAA